MCLILLSNSHSLLYGVSLSPILLLEQPLIVIWDNCGLFSFSTSIHCYMRTCALFPFSTAIHCYIGIIVAYSPLEQPFLVICEVVPLFSFSTAISMLYMIIVAYFRFQHPFFVICELVAYSPLQQPFIVISDHCGLLFFSTAIHCYIGSLWLIFL